MTKGKDAVSIWLEGDCAWNYTKDVSRRRAVSDSVESFVHNSIFRRESGSRLVSYTKEAVIPVITAAALTNLAVELREDVQSLLREIAVAAVEPMILLLTENQYDSFYGLLKQLREPDGVAAEMARFAIRTTRVISLESLTEIASDQEARQDWFTAVQRIAREYQSGNYGGGGIVLSATALDDELDRYVGPEPIHRWMERKQERQLRMKAGLRRAEELQQNVLEQRRAEERARAEYYEKMAAASTALLLWRRNNR